jgi:bile acid-coenzyme A ligase
MIVSIARALQRLAEDAPDRPCVTHEDRTVTRGEMDRRTNQLARAFADRGVKQDDLVAIALPNGIAFYEAAIATWKLGATPLPVSSRLPRRELDAILEVARPTLVIETADTLDASRFADTPLPDRIASAWKAPTSGGSTGRPKVIVAGTPGTVDLDAEPMFKIRRDGVHVVPGPLYHNAPFTSSCLGLFAGNHVVVMSRFDARRTLALVQEHRADFLLLVPTMMHRIWRLPASERNAFDLSSLATVWHMAAPCPPWLKEAWIEWLGADRIFELYAGTEIQAMTVITGAEALTHPGSVGRVAAGEMRICDEHGGVVPPGEVGEVFMRRPDGTPPTYRYIGAEVKERDGWESLGDMGWMDADGYLYLTDRLTDMILVGGANVYPAEIEAALDDHPRVVSSAVIGLPDDDLGQRIHAIVQLDGDVSDEELTHHLAERVAKIKLPRSYERVAHALRDDAGKVRRSALRQERMRP